MEEIWKPIEGYENYSVSTFGNVRNDKIGRIGRILKGINVKGRLMIGLHKNGINKRFLIYRLVALAFIPNPEGKSDVDHIDNNPSNNRIENLRWATSCENNRNRQITTTNTSGVKGVSWHKRDQKWGAKITVDGIQIYIGYYNTIEEATIARQTRANQVFGNFTNACEKV